VSFAAITLCVASQRMFVVVYFVIDSVRKILVNPRMGEECSMHGPVHKCVHKFCPMILWEETTFKT
jgi:hypothetical protein